MTKALITPPQIKELLLAGGEQTSRVRGGLIGLLAERTSLDNLRGRPLSELVGITLALEQSSEKPLGSAVQSIIAQGLIQEPESHLAARDIMGKNFLGVPEVTETFGLVSPEAQAALANIPFSETTLRRRRKSHVLVADVGLSLNGVYNRMENHLFFYRFNVLGEVRWYLQDAFATHTEQATWRLIRRTRVGKSTEKLWDEQIALVRKYEEVPTARQMVYAIMLAYAATGKRLFARGYVRTNDVCSHGFLVIIGKNDPEGFFIGNERGDRDPKIGICSSVKASPLAA